MGAPMLLRRASAGPQLSQREQHYSASSGLRDGRAEMSVEGFYVRVVQLAVKALQRRQRPGGSADGFGSSAA
jgi:hypothetical protein